MKKRNSDTPLGRHKIGRETRTSGMTSGKGRDCRLENGECSRIYTKTSKSEIHKYVTELVSETWSMIKSGEIDIYPAKIGYDPFTGASVWDYNGLLQILVAAGHCSKCAANFVDSLADVKNENGFPENIMVITGINSARTDACLKYALRAKLAGL